MTDYAELQVTSNFSFLRGASHPYELIGQAAELGYHAIALTDRNTLAGIVRAWSEIRSNKYDLRLVIGARLDLIDGPSLLCLPTNVAAYGRLTTLLTVGKRRAPKGQCHIAKADVFAHGEGQIMIVVPPEKPDAAFASDLARFGEAFARRCYLAAHHLYRGDDAARLAHLAGLAREARTPLVATNDAHFHAPERRALQDVLTCIREKCTIREAGFRLFANAERHLKEPKEMARLFRDHPEAIARTIEIAERCRFSLDQLRYEYPAETPHTGRTPQEELVYLAWEGARWRYPGGIPDKVSSGLEHELALIAEKNYAPFFLTVHHIVTYARSKAILCQGRGSAANSVVCYCLRITEVNPMKHGLLFARFVSAARNEPPDIDVDFEHERREEVIQHIYEKYGRDHAAIAATVIHYRARAAIRDVGKVMGLSRDTIAALAGTTWGWSNEGIGKEHVRELGLDPDDRILRQTLRLAFTLTGFPRHLSQHVGGFVISRTPLYELVPIENAAMEDRTVIEWDKDDLNDLDMLKVDVLALGMLTCIRKGFDLLARHYDRNLTIDTVPHEAPEVYEMLGRADSIGVFQVESRAQMSMLPRLRPEKFYDLVIEVAIVRPGPIQGDMVHPYLRRREGKEPVHYPSKALEEVLDKTLGVPLFQEQAMQIAIVAAGFTGDEADGLRRAMATFKRNGDIPQFRAKMIEGMVANGYARDFAERCFNQIEGFGNYGFPEAHAASFAILVYVSAWLKCVHPDVFACALLNSQPMGFYAPAQLVRDARDHGVEVRAVDVNHSDWDCTLEPTGGAMRALRLGFRQVNGFAEGDAKTLVARRGAGYASPDDLARRTGLASAAIACLARADAWGSIRLDRRPALWAARGILPMPLPLLAAAEQPDDTRAAIPLLPAMSLGEQVVEDYTTLFLSLKAHPMQLLRDRFERLCAAPARRLPDLEPGDTVRVGGLVIVRQQPGTARGVIFITIEDETGIANLIVWQSVFERYRRIVLGSKLLLVEGKLQREGLVIHIVAERLGDRSDWLRDLGRNSGSFSTAAGRGDEAKRPGYDRRTLPYRSRDFH
jgi:error-prone DNA polymerase